MKRQDWQNLNAEHLAIARLVDLRLKSNPEFISNPESSVSHPDSDLVTSFVEGRLEAGDARAIISHLVRCSSCRHLTAQLARTLPEDCEVGNAVMPAETSSAVDGIIERLRESFAPSSEDAVFAYQETDQTTGAAAKPEAGNQDEDERTTR